MEGDFTLFSKINSLVSMPIAVFGSNGKLIYITSQNNSVYTHIFEKIYQENIETKGPELVNGVLSVFIIITDKSNGNKIISGPFINSSITPFNIKKISEKYNLNKIIAPNSLISLINQISHSSYLDFLNYFTFLEYIINKKNINLLDYFQENQEKTLQKSTKNEILGLNQQGESEFNNLHNTYDTEHLIYKYIEEGNVNGLNEFFLKTITHTAMNEGILAKDELRQQKNIFLGLITCIGKFPAIKGGLSVEEAYSMIDRYSQECEKLTSIEEIFKLRYLVLIEFAKKVNEVKFKSKYSQEVSNALNFIQSNLCANISIDDVLTSVKKGRTSFLNKFKKETGVTLGKYIVKAKLEESKNYLLYTNMSILEISMVLYFSSQGYFQNLFKKEFGITPLNFRKAKFTN